MSEETLNITLKVWRQDGPDDRGRFETYQADNISTHASFLEMLDVVNENLNDCLLYTSPSPRDQRGSRMPSSA